MSKMTLLTIARMTEEEARAAFEREIWAKDHPCPHCGTVDESTRLNGKAHRVGLWKCRACERQHTVTVGTVMHRTKLPLRTWLTAFYLMATSKKGISALQMQRQLGIGSYKTAWHLCHRIRWAMQNGMTTKLGGPGKVVEVDEVFLGGREKSRHIRKRGIKSKTPVLALVERGGAVRAFPVHRVDGETLKPAVLAHVDKRSRLNTDGWTGYITVGEEFKGGHGVVNHSQDEYVRGNDYTNTVECFFALLRRGVMGSFHSISERHMAFYLDEFAFRFSHNKASDESRTRRAIRQAVGVRLAYYRPKRQQVA